MRRFIRLISSLTLALALTASLSISTLAGDKNAVTPSADFLIERLLTVSTITAAGAATEETDPNNLLHKAGGYQDYVFFKDSQVPNADNYYGKTDGGGVVEVYSTSEGATKRNTYLSAFDGQGALDPGSHFVYGTCVIRTSSKLTATQQNTLSAAIKTAIAADSLPGQVQNPTTVYKGVDYSAEFNPQVYYNNNPDLQAALGTDGKALIKHYVEFGKQEGRKAK